MKRRGNHGLHAVELAPFGFGERDTGLSLLGEPPGEPLMDEVGVGDECVVRADGIADQRNEISHPSPWSRSSS